MSKIRVRATKRGLYRGLRKVGDEFEIDKGAHFSERWMQRLSAPRKRKEQNGGAGVEKNDESDDVLD